MEIWQPTRYKEDRTMITKMKMWMFECTGEWNVFTFTDEQTIEAYKETVAAYEECKKYKIIPKPPFTLDSI